jgi:hypothetical protein
MSAGDRATLIFVGVVALIGLCLWLEVPERLRDWRRGRAVAAALRAQELVDAERKRVKRERELAKRRRKWKRKLAKRDSMRAEALGMTLKEYEALPLGLLGDPPEDKSSRTLLSELLGMTREDYDELRWRDERALLSQFTTPPWSERWTTTPPDDSA